jgi:hypothetical protein
MDKDFLLYGNAARVGVKAKRITGANETNTATSQKGQDYDEEFAKKEVDNQKL